MIVGEHRMRDAVEIDRREFADFYGRYVEICLRAGIKSLAPEDAMIAVAQAQVSPFGKMHPDAGFGGRLLLAEITPTLLRVTSPINFAAILNATAKQL